MKNMRLTRAGAEMLGTAHADGESRYWIGYYGLAYVADRETDSISVAAQSGELTQSGDYIYNIWQGDMLNGYAQTNPEDTAAASLFGLTLYDKSIRTNYRYVYYPGSKTDENDPPRNRLVAWKSESDGNGENTLVRKGATVYEGTYMYKYGIQTRVKESDIPLPAPLYYGGEPSDATISSSVAPVDAVPVSADYRYYVGVRDGGEYGWKDSSSTQSSTTVTDQSLLGSISNFNKFHGTVSSEGYGVSSVSSCHNMSRATKLFPISYYNVVNDNGGKVAETQYPDNSAARKPLATAIKFSIDLSPVTADSGYTALNYEDGIVDDQDTGMAGVYTSKYVSFKFNRIGIYAVPMTVHRYSTDSSVGDCNLQKVQFEIDSDAEPILFAVADINDTIITDNPDSPEGGVAKFNLEFVLNVGNEESMVEQRTAVYYDLYESDASTWYKNQLLATASLSEAVTSLSLEMNAMKQQAGGGTKECGSSDPDLSRYALKNHTHDYMKNLVDGTANYGSVRGVDTYEEGDGTEIPSLFGIIDNAPAGTKKSCHLAAIPTWESGTDLAIPASYVYSAGFVQSGSVPAASAGCITLEQLAIIVKVKGVDWLASNAVTSSGWLAAGTTVPEGQGAVYVWLTPNTYAIVDVHTGEIVTNQLNAGSTDMYQAIVLKNAVSETMFSNGYVVGTDSVVMGDSTASSGDRSLVQGDRAYSNSKNSTLLGVELVKCDTSPFVTVLGGTGFDIKDSSHSIVFGDGSSSATNDRPTELKHVSNSIVGGSFSDDGSHLMTNGISSSLVLAQHAGDHSYGAEGTINGSVIAGAVMLGKSTQGNSANNSVILRQGELAASRVLGQVSNSMVLGDGYSHYAEGTNDEELDKKIAVSNSVHIAANVHEYLTDGEKAWCKFKNWSVVTPSSTYSVQVGGNARKPLWDSMLLSSGGLDVAPFSINTRLANVQETPDGATYSILIGASSAVGENVSDAVVLGGGNLVPDNSNALVMIGNENRVNRYTDEVMELSDFNAAVAQGTLTNDRYYVILGSGNLKVSNGAGGYMDVQLSGAADNIYAGIRVDANGIITYEPNVTSQYTINSRTRKVSFGLARENRLNPRKLNSSIIVGSSNGVGSVQTSGLSMVGDGNSASLLYLTNVSVFGSGVHLDGSDAHAYGENGGKPQYPVVGNTHVFNSGLSFNLNSLEPYATHSLSGALTNLHGAYDQSIYGIFSHPMNYTSMPTEDSPASPWTVDLANSMFRVDPNLFSNYGDAWEALYGSAGRTFWNNYKTSDGTSDSRWGAVTQRAEANQSEGDTYRGDSSFADPFTGRSRSQIRAMIAKPSAPMVYTGGIAVAGFAASGDDDNFGLIKLGHLSKSSSYVASRPVSGWSPYGNLVIPASITGTTECPYGGMVLAVDGKQELDGTMHLVLARNGDSRVNYRYDSTYSNCTENTAINKVTAGNLYVVKTASGIRVDVNMDSGLNTGDVFIVRHVGSGTVRVNSVMAAGDSEAIELAVNKSYIIKKCSYVSAGDPSSRYLVMPLN